MCTVLLMSYESRSKKITKKKIIAVKLPLVSLTLFLNLPKSNEKQAKSPTKFIVKCVSAIITVYHQCKIYWSGPTKVDRIKKHLRKGKELQN